MIEFFQALGHYTFIQYAFITGLLASIVCGVIGSIVVTRRITYVAGAMAHFVLGGMGLARYLQVTQGWNWLEPIHGAIVSAIAAAIIIGMVRQRRREREDTIIGAMWAIGMAIGIIFIASTPGYNQDLMSYLFGNILMVSASDITLLIILDIVTLGTTAAFYSKLVAVCFDEEHARLRGINVELYYILLLILAALTVVVLISVVGIVMVIALLTLPAAIAGQFTRTLGTMMIGATVLSMLFTTGGLALSYGPNLPAGATIILLAGLIYILTTLFRKVRA